MNFKAFLCITLASLFAGCDHTASDTSLAARVDAIIKQQSIAPEEHYIAIAWVEEGSETLEMLQRETASFVSQRFTPKPDRTQFSPESYRSHEGYLMSGGGACICVWKGAKPDLAALVSHLERFDDQNKAARLIVKTK